MVRRPKEGARTFVPREKCANPKQFGKTEMDLEPTPEVEATDVQFQTALLQHAVVNRVREELLRAGRSLADLTHQSSVQQRPDRLERIFRGETMMTIADLVHWSSEFPRVGQLVADRLGASAAATAPPVEVYVVREPEPEEMAAAFAARQRQALHADREAIANQRLRTAGVVPRSRAGQ